MNFIFIFVHLIAFASNDISCLQFLWSVIFQDLIHRPFRNFPGYLETVWTIRKISRLSRNFPDHPENIQLIRKISSPSGNFLGNPETFQIIRKISSLSGKYPAYLENIQPIQKISSLSGNFPAYPETFQAIRKLSRLSRNFPDHPENIQPIRKISRQSGKNPDYLEIFQRVRKLPSAILRVTRKNFPGAQKLSGWQCHPATQVFGPLTCPQVQVKWALILICRTKWLIISRRPGHKCTRSGQRERGNHLHCFPIWPSWTIFDLRKCFV